MAARKSKISSLGWEIKRCLAEMQLSQTEFCKQHNIPMTRLSELISGSQPNHKIRRQVIKLLQINDF